MLFNSTTSPIPPVRRDIQVIPITQDDQELLYFHDPMKYSNSGFALLRVAEPILSLLNGRKSVNHIVAMLKNGLTANQLIDFVQLLDKNLILETENFAEKATSLENQFESNGIRKPALAGNSYPDEPGQLQQFVNGMMASADLASSPHVPKKALYAPHIDLRVGGRQYAEAFSLLRDHKPRRVVILATSHYSSYHPEIYNDTPFIGTEKNFELPGRVLTTDLQSVAKLEERSEELGFTTRDRAHRVEHSIETHLLFANHIWKHSFTVLPILVGSIDEILYKRDGSLEHKIDRFAHALSELDTEDTFYLISGDLSHVGKKFGDSASAASIRSEVEMFDRKFIEAATQNNNRKMLDHIAADYDPYRICGFPPLYTFLKTFPGISGRSLNYHWWDEKEKDSAVSFASISY